MSMNPDMGQIAPVNAIGAESLEVPSVGQPHLIFNADDPRLEEMTREQRIQQHFARELALGNMDALNPRYRSSDHDPDNPWADIAVQDPMSDPQVGEIATQLRIAGITRELSELIDD